MRAQSQRPYGRLFPGRRRPLTIGFDPRSLFRNGEQGVIYDPSDLSTLYQEAAGTTPVTAAGQPVGLMLDKSGRGNHAFQPNAASRPMLRQNATTGAFYLETDGSDDWMQTNSIDFTGTDKVSLFTGVRKLVDGAQFFVELSASAEANVAAFGLQCINTANATVYRSRGSGATQAAIGAALTPPVNAVLSGLSGINVPFSRIRINGVQSAENTAFQGSGNYGNYPLYLFRRGGTTSPFAGHFYGLTIVGRLCTDVETRNVERLYAAKTGVTLA